MPSLARRTLLGASAAVGLPAAAQSTEVRCGALFPFSGSLALLGDESFRGLEIAVEERNAGGGILARPIRLVRGDAVDTGQAVAEARRLTGPERVAAVFGTYASPLSFAATQVTELLGIPYFELGAISDPITERGFRYLFRSCPRASDFALATVAAVTDALAPLWGVDATAVRVAILHEDGLYGQTLANFQEAQLRARGVPPVERLGYVSRGIDLSSIVQRLKAAAADVVLHSGYQNDIVVFARGLREAAWKPRMVIGSGAGYSLADTARAIGPEFDGTMNVDFTQVEVNERAAPGVRAFAELYRRRYGTEPRSGHSLANYHGAGTFLDAILRAGSLDKDRVRAAVLATDVTEGTTPTGWGMRFDERGQNTRARPFLLQWQGGRQVTVFPRQAAVAELRGQLGG